MAQNVQKPFFFVFLTTESHFEQVLDTQGDLNTGIKSLYLLIILKGRIIKKIYLYCVVNILNVSVLLIKVVHFLITFLNLHTPISSHLSVSFR